MNTDCSIMFSEDGEFLVHMAVPCNTPRQGTSEADKDRTYHCSENSTTSETRMVIESFEQKWHCYNL